LPSWVFTTKLVAKPDQLIKRRGKAGLLALNKTWDEAKPWITHKAGKPQKVCLFVLSFYVKCSTLDPWCLVRKYLGRLCHILSIFLPAHLLLLSFICANVFVGKQHAISRRLSVGTRLQTTT
jgi:hypothetical protein